MSERERLPNRRGAETIVFEHGGRRWRASFGLFGDGRLAELFLDGRRESPIAEAARESALLAAITEAHNG
jgi:hypothetical protein